MHKPYPGGSTSSGGFFVRGLPGVTDLIISGIIQIHHTGRQVRHIDRLDVCLMGVLSTEVSDERSFPAVQHRRAHHHLDVSAAVSLSSTTLKPRSISEFPFSMRLPATFKVFPSFNIDVGSRDISSGSLISSIEGLNWQEDGRGPRSKIGHLSTSNGYALSARLQLFPLRTPRPFDHYGIILTRNLIKWSLILPPIRIADGMYPIEPEIIQSTFATSPIVIRNEDVKVSFAPCVRSGGRFTVRITLQEDMISQQRMGRKNWAMGLADHHETVRIRFDVMQKVVFELANVGGSVETPVHAVVKNLKRITEAQTVVIDIPYLPPTTFANPYLNISYFIQAKVTFLSSKLPPLSRLFNAIRSEDHELFNGPLVIAPFSKRTAGRALSEAPWLLLPHKKAMVVQVAVPAVTSSSTARRPSWRSISRRSSSAPLPPPTEPAMYRGERRAEDWLMDGMSYGDDCADAVEIPFDFYKPPSSNFTDTLPVYEANPI
ncbi:hypothetical protein BC829DRAFT_414313 [Chytridium lagenaria]|nr:hypothetical protein BC829DRAFT_414313 [Chytridium lagenaria]